MCVCVGIWPSTSITLDNSTFPNGSPEELVDTCKRHIRLTEGVVSRIPKHHTWVHMVHRARVRGNPKGYATWIAEGDNKRFKLLCAKAHALVWSRRVLHNWQQAFGQTDGVGDRKRLRESVE